MAKPLFFRVSNAALDGWLRVAPESDVAGLIEELHEARELTQDDVVAAFGPPPKGHDNDTYFLLPNEKEIAIVSGVVVIAIWSLTEARRRVLLDLPPDARAREAAVRRAQGARREALRQPNMAWLPPAHAWPTTRAGLDTLKQLGVQALSDAQREGLDQQPIQAALATINAAKRQANAVEQAALLASVSERSLVVALRDIVLQNCDVGALSPEARRTLDSARAFLTQRAESATKEQQP